MKILDPYFQHLILDFLLRVTHNKREIAAKELFEFQPQLQEVFQLMKDSRNIVEVFSFYSLKFSTELERKEISKCNQQLHGKRQKVKKTFSSNFLLIRIWSMRCQRVLIKPYNERKLQSIRFSSHVDSAHCRKHIVREECDCRRRQRSIDIQEKFKWD